MNENTTILYITDSVLDPWLAGICRENILEAADGKRIVSVSQEPLDFGDNIFLEGIGRSSYSMDRQLIEGLKVIDTPWVAMAEHDCLYNKEHFDFVPPDPEYFWYNINCWLVQINHKVYPQYNNMYSCFPRRLAQSMLICDTDLYREAMDCKVQITGHPSWSMTHARLGEPGTSLLHKVERLAKARKTPKDLWPALRTYVHKYLSKTFRTKDPTLDIRHCGNFTGNRRGHHRTWELEPWGRFEDVLSNYSTQTIGA